MVDGRTEKTVICVKTKEGRQKTLAISKILSIRSCGVGYEGKHLKQALAYILAPEKTSEGRLVRALNCQKEQGYEQMWQTKELFDISGGRLGGHVVGGRDIISFCLLWRGKWTRILPLRLWADLQRNI